MGGNRDGGIRRVIGLSRYPDMNALGLIIQFLIRSAGVLVVLSGVGVIGFQIFIFLKGGTWISLSMLELMPIIPGDLAAWLRYPESWLGLHKLVYGFLDAMPLSLLALIIGAVMMNFDAYVDDRTRV